MTEKISPAPAPKKIEVKNSFSALETIEELPEDVEYPPGLNTRSAEDLLEEADYLTLQQKKEKEHLCQNGVWVDVRPKKMSKVKAANWKPFVGALWEQSSPKACCPVQPAAAQPAAQEIAAVNYKSMEAGWTKIRAIPDSGAVESVAPASMVPADRVHSSPGSERGQMYTTANGGEIPNEGQQYLPSVCGNGVCSEQKWQLSAVTRPLQSVGELCDAGNRVIFGRSGGIIQNIVSGEETYISRENGTYLVDLWIPPVSEVAGREGHEQVCTS